MHLPGIRLTRASGCASYPRPEWAAWVCLVVLAGLLFAAGAARAASVVERFPEARNFFPQATRFGDFEGKPAAAPVYRGEKVVGYVFQTKMVAPIPAYSGKPVNVLVGIDTTGRITGTHVLEQSEPILLVGIPVQKLYDFVARYVGHKVSDDIVVGGGGAGSVKIDAISSATVTSMVVNRTIMQAALEVAVSRHVVAPPAGSAAGPAHVRRFFREANWQQLTGNGAIRHLLITRPQVNEAFKGTQGEVRRSGDNAAGVGSTCLDYLPGKPCDVFIDLYYAYLNAPTIGRNLLGKQQYTDLMSRLAPGEHAIAVFANGVYSFKGLGYVRGGIFDRLHLVQHGQTILFHDSDYERLADVSLAGMPQFGEMAIFIVRAPYRFDPGGKWELQLLVRRQTGPLSSVFTTFTGEYAIPQAYVRRPAPPRQAASRTAGTGTESAAAQQATARAGSPGGAQTTPLWMSVWRQQPVRIGILLGGLFVLLLILVFQDLLVRRPRLLGRLRVGYLLFTLFFIGWYALGQLSVVNIFTFLHAMFHDFHWDLFLMDPVVFILWVFVAGAVLLWGRGVYCGWLCPFGALQQLTNYLARRLRVPQYDLPRLVHERLWAIKYLVLLALFGISLQSVEAAERYAEVEPFKTAIMLHFVRDWGFVLYAGALVAISAVNNKFYCKYLCPLGAGLAIPSRFRVFNWLRRRKECGKPCQVCAKECEIQAISETGEIHLEECHYCLDCQMTYWNQYKCPPLVERRKKRERRSRSAPVPAPGTDAGDAPSARDSVYVPVPLPAARAPSVREASGTGRRRVHELSLSIGGNSP